MADIRIKDLATTAASTASDDFIAVDGSANGTRKLNAYSPTFGGNLTVSGTALLGTSDANLGSYFDYNVGVGGAAALWMKQTTKNAASSTLLGGGTYTLLNGPSGGSLYLRIGNVDGLTIDSSRNTTLAGNLTVSGTSGISIGSATFSGGRALTATTGGGNSVAIRLTQTGVADWEIENEATTGALSFQQSLTDYARLTATGNFLLGTTTDGGQKLQVNGTAAIAGNLTVTGDIITASSYVFKSLGHAYLDSNTGKDVYLRTNGGTTALTLDSSQNATFAGKTYTAAGTAAAPAISFSGDTDSGFYNPGGNQVALSCGGGQIWNTTVNGLSIAAGKDIYLGNAYQAGAPTATGYLTIKDSNGNAYKIPVVAV